MSLSVKEFWTLFHGIILFGVVYHFLGLAGLMRGLGQLKPRDLSIPQFFVKVKELRVSMSIIAVALWIAVITGTYIVYPWYRATPPVGANLEKFPRSFLLSKEETANWHIFGMEWKEHIAWFAPILATAVAYLISKYKGQIAHEPLVARTLVVFFILIFFSSAVAGLLGVIINNIAPIR